MIAAPGPSVVPDYVNERYLLETTGDQVEATGPLPRIQVTDLIRTLDAPVPAPLPPGVTAAIIDDLNRQNRPAAAAFVNSIPGARLYPVPNTTHYVQVQRPDVVISAIRAATTGATLSPPR